MSKSVDYETVYPPFAMAQIVGMKALESTHNSVRFSNFDYRPLTAASRSSLYDFANAWSKPPSP